jgi:hypothetical protein
LLCATWLASAGAALVTTVFLHGTQRRQDATADDQAVGAE